MDTIFLRLMPKLLVFPVLACFLAGCEETEAMRHARVERERTMAMDVEALKAVDAHNAEELAATMDMIREKNEEDVARTRANAQVLRDLPKTEEKRWLDRQDDIRKTIKHEFGGNLPEIEQTVPYFIY